MRGSDNTKLYVQVTRFPCPHQRRKYCADTNGAVFWAYDDDIAFVTIERVRKLLAIYLLIAPIKFVAL